MATAIAGQVLGPQPGRAICSFWQGGVEMSLRLIAPTVSDLSVTYILLQFAIYILYTTYVVMLFVIPGNDRCHDIYNGSIRSSVPGCKFSWNVFQPTLSTCKETFRSLYYSHTHISKVGSLPALIAVCIALGTLISGNIALVPSDHLQTGTLGSSGCVLAVTALSMVIELLLIVVRICNIGLINIKVKIFLIAVS